jgi:hypothetical protein
MTEQALEVSNVEDVSDSPCEDLENADFEAHLGDNDMDRLHGGHQVLIELPDGTVIDLVRIRDTETTATHPEEDTDDPSEPEEGETGSDDSVTATPPKTTPEQGVEDLELPQCPHCD